MYYFRRTKQRMMNKVLITIFSFLTAISYSQEHCGTHVSDEAMQTYYQRDRSHLQNNLKVGNVVDVPIIYHVMRQSNGVGAFNLLNTLRLHCELNENFLDADINFYIKDIIFYNNDNYYNMTGSQGSGNSMMSNLNNPNVCNVYVVKVAKSGNNTVCGYSFVPMNYPGPNRGGIVLGMNCAGVGSTTLTHEMGHYLNLPHTFYRWEGSDYNLSPIPSYLWERADGSNCSSTGDGFCDTPADYISDRWSCTLPEIFSDAVGQTFTIDEKNYMSYSMDGCQQYFKNDQMAEMKNTPSTYRSYLGNLTPPNLSPLAQANLIYPPNNNQTISADTVKFEWDEIQGADYYIFKLTLANSNNIIVEEIITNNSYEMFTLNNNVNYDWQVKGFNYGYVCTDFVENTFKTAPFVVSVKVDNVFCNQAADGNAYADAGEVTISSYKWSKFDTLTNTYVLFNTTTTNVIHVLAEGDYLVEMISVSNGSSTKAFSITEPAPLTDVLTLIGNTIVANVSGGTPPYSYLWSNGETTQTNFNPVIGTNTLYLSDSKSCFKSSLFTFNGGENPSAINNVLTNISKLVLYPNPLTGNILSISFDSETNEKMSLEIYSIDGKWISKSMKNVAIGKNAYSLSFNGLNKGVYFIKIKMNKQSITKKILL